MKKTVMAIGIGVLVAMMLPSHGGNGGVERWDASFPQGKGNFKEP